MVATVCGATALASSRVSKQWVADMLTVADNLKVNITIKPYAEWLFIVKALLYSVCQFLHDLTLKACLNLRVFEITCSIEKISTELFINTPYGPTF